MRLRNKVIVVIPILLMAMGIFGSVSWSRRIQETKVQFNRNDKFSRDNKTKALQVEKVEVLTQSIKVSLKNVSTKTIDGIQLSINGGYLQIDFLGAYEENYQRLLPGAVYEQFLSPQDISQPLDIRVLAVTFDDKSSDGDPILAREIMDTRRGYNKQLKRVRPLVEAALSSPDGDSIGILDKLKSQVERLSNDEGTDSGAIKEGRQSAQEETLYEIEFLRQRQIATGALPIRRALAKMKNRHDKRIQNDPE